MVRQATLLALLVLLAASVSGFLRPNFRPRYPAKAKGFIPKQILTAGNETYLSNIRALTTEGTNAEAYWSFDGTRLSFQSIREPLADTHPCDQIYTMYVNGNPDIQLVSTGKGRDTCAYFTPDGEHVIYSSTQAGMPGQDGKHCPATPDMNYGYLWPLYKSMDIYSVHLKTGTLKQLTNSVGYDAETTISPNKTQLVFTSDRDGDLELYIADLEIKTVRRMTYTPGYDGGAYFSNNGNMLVWRGNRPQGSDLTDYLNLLELGLVEPTDMQLFVMTDINNPNSVVQVTNNGAVNFAPFFLPNDDGIIFSSNVHDPTGGDFQLYMIKLDGTGLTRLTFEGSFNCFPMFSPDGKYLAWESNRGVTSPMDINIMVAQWTPQS